jgi:hypothetical protein
MELYPDIDDPDFQFLIAQKLEFRDLTNPDGLYDHQEFVRRFLSPYTPYRCLILFHNLGSGKSIACIAVAVDHFLHDGKRCIIVTKGQSGTDNFMKQIARYRNMCSNTEQWDESIFWMRHYMSLSNQIKDMSDNDVARAYSNKTIILDEVHNVRYFTKEETGVYASILRILQICTNVKTMMATATPMTDNPEQLMSLLGLCNHNRDPDNNSMSGIISYNPFILDKPISSYMGTDNIIPGLKVYESDMAGHQRAVYCKEVSKGVPKDIYRSLTHISLYCFEDPSEASASGTYGRAITDSMMVRTKHVKTITPMSTERTREIKYVKYTVKPEFVHMLSGDGLRNSSCKYSALINALHNTTGNVFVFVEEVRGSGLLLLASILEEHGYELYIGEDISRIPKRPRYTLCVGSTDLCPNVPDRLDGFNSELNRHGDYVRILLGSKVIGESITLLNVRQFHCVTPHWNDSTINQAVGRVVRNGSHNALDKEDRRVDIYVHAAVLHDHPDKSIDIIKLLICQKKQTSIQCLEEAMIDNAVDRYCIVKHNAVTIPVKYFSTFAAAYTRYHMPSILERAKGLLNMHVDIDDLSSMLGIHPLICKETVCYAIQNNTPVNGMYLRAYKNCVFTVDDPSLPSVTLPPRKHDQPDMEVCSYDLPPIMPQSTERIEVVEFFRYMPVRQKAHFLEHCVSEHRSDILVHISTVYAIIDNLVHHFLWYRNLESSYTSSNLVPKKREGKTRCFSEGQWVTVSALDEVHVFSEYSTLVDNFMKIVDSHPIYGIISTIDGGMRIRLRGTENYNISAKDHRYIRRGKSIKSIKKDMLMSMHYMLTNRAEHLDTIKSMSIHEIIEHINRRIIGMGLYAIV